MLSEEREGVLDEECGVAALWLASLETSAVLLDALDALQHRGQEAAGLATLHRISESGPCALNVSKAPGRVESLRAALEQSPSPHDERRLIAALGHVRYSTSRGKGMACAQPLVRRTRHGLVALAHNGHITNAAQLRAELGVEADEQRSSDTAVLLDLLERSSRPSLRDALEESIARLEGAFSMVLLHEEEGLFAWRDRYGIRPLVHGGVKVAGEEGWMLASETVAFSSRVEALSPARELPAGAILHLKVGARTPEIRAWRGRHSAPAERGHNCLFELVYFASARSVVFDVDVRRARGRMGEALYHEHAARLPDDVDMVLAVPESSRPAAQGFARAAALPFEEAIRRREGSVKRSFIEPDEASRKAVVAAKFEVDCGLVRGKRVVVVDDSLVRGTTAHEIVALLRRAGVKKIYLCIASAPIISPCRYGIDTPGTEELLAARKEREELESSLGVELLCYLSLDGLRRAAREGGESFCDACFSGRYIEQG